MSFNHTLIERGKTTQYWTQSVFWFVFICLGIYIYPPHLNFWNSILCSAGNALFYFISININLYVLLPKFMLRQSILSYLALLIALALLLTPFMTMFNIWMLSYELKPNPNSLSSPYHNFINLIILTALSSLIRIPLDWLKMQAEKNELVTRNIETELQSLKNQINPHFLFNTLNNLYALTLKKSDLAPEVVLKLSDMMRYMLYECNEKEVSMEKEFRYIQNYIELEKLRHATNSGIKLNIDEALYSKYIAPLLLIPFIENSYKHGFHNRLDKAYIHINASLENEYLVFSVVNSKATVLPSQLNQKKQGGVGLSNVRKRLDLIYPSNHTLIIDDMPDSYSVLLKLKLNKLEK
ncbi:MAG: histidine kinase [Saprospiraceae bacterium]|nr:histidine kinase [Saprospiraceae bacterium]MBK8449826.1 histidine kinase [Saprospiraceae bacterium]MBK9221520.1 histidine kinase [Saprospiraceae bacterium]MBK9721542.1 histidine kinase [Saprospiraceae bacterium]MBK9728607.1 histidine kinase [Saprospiraceae bacterium]